LREAKKEEKQRVSHRRRAIGLSTGTHRYGYVDGNPVLYVDPGGNIPISPHA